jgi:hypothetical protein
MCNRKSKKEILGKSEINLIYFIFSKKHKKVMKSHAISYAPNSKLIFFRNFHLGVYHYNNRNKYIN